MAQNYILPRFPKSRKGKLKCSSNVKQNWFDYHPFVFNICEAKASFVVASD